MSLIRCSILLLVMFIIRRSSSRVEDEVITYEPPAPTVTMDETLAVVFRIYFTGPDKGDVGDLGLLTTSLNTDILTASNDLVVKCVNPSCRYYTGHFNLTGVFLGIVNIRIQIRHKDQNYAFIDDHLRVKIVRKPGVIDTIFTASVATLVSLIYINFGCALDWGELVNSVKKPSGPAIGFVGQFVTMPLLSFGMGKLLFPDNPELQLGTFFAGVSPGGGDPNMCTVLFEGNKHLSIAMTAISKLAAFFMIPFWIFTLGRLIFDEGNISIPYGDISKFVAALIVPLFIGFLIQRCLKKFGRFMAMILKGISAVLALFILVFAIATNLYIFQLFSWRIVVAGLGLPWLGYTLAYILANLCKQSPKDCLTIAIETGIQNTGLSIFLLHFTLPQPEADLTTVIAVAVATMTPVPVLLVYFYIKLGKRFYLNKEGILDVDDTDAAHGMDETRDLKIPMKSCT